MNVTILKEYPPAVDRMKRSPSPLRYPGGKSALFPFVSELISSNGLEDGHYAEPFAGGAGLALSLMFNDVVSEIHLNDIDRSIYTFWDAVLNKTESFIECIENVDISVDEWHRQRQVQLEKETANAFELGFSTFYLNRTNRSGILKGGIIGGKHQNSQYQIDCRFKKEKLIKKIQHIQKYREHVHLYNCDAAEFISKIESKFPENVFFCIDPPYYSKGHTLYTNYYQHSDHEKLAEVILNLDRPWMLTYDNSPTIAKLYESKALFNFSLKYSLARKRIGRELLVLSDKLTLRKESNMEEILKRYSFVQKQNSAASRY